MENSNQVSITASINKFQEGSDFDTMNKAIMAYASEQIEKAKGVVFRVKVPGRNDIFDTYLNGFADSEKQSHNCNCCKGFLRRYGGLVTIDDNNQIKSLLWNEDIVSDYYKQPIANMRKLVESKRIETVFYKPKFFNPIVGFIEKGGFHHFAFDTKNVIQSNYECISSASAGAVSAENYRIVVNNLSVYNLSFLETVLEYFKLDVSLKNHDQYINNLTWFVELERAKLRAKDNVSARVNVIWKAIANASPGKIKILGTVVGEFLNNVSSGETYESAKYKFLEMVKADKYMRPTVAPSKGTVETAERIFKELDLESALDRRYLSVDEITDYVWKPKVSVETGEKKGIFSDIVTKDSNTEQSPGVVDGGVMSWAAFEKDILPTVNKLEIKFKPGAKYLFGAFTTANIPDSKPLMSWDTVEKRNPVSGYIRSGGAHPEEFGINNGIAEVALVSYQPNEMLSDTKSQERFIILKDAKDTIKAGLAIFPECLRPELHQVRSVIEAYSNKGELKDVANPACGIRIPARNDLIIILTFIATVGKFVVKYNINQAI